jgi:hypothetical protein
MLWSVDGPGTDNTDSGGWGANETFAVLIDWATAYTLPNDQTTGTPATFYRLARAHSYGTQGDYSSQINGGTDKTFSKFSFTTNYDTSIPGFGSGTHAAEFVLLPTGGNPTAASPTFSPVAGTYGSTQSVTISTTSGGVICYNTTGTPATNGTTGCTTGTLYTTPVSVSASETLYAVAGGTGFVDSAIGSAAYTISANVANPTASPTAGTFTTTQTVTLSSSTAGATLCYTTNGTAPAATTPGTCSAGTTYTTPISVSATETIKVLATLSGFTNSSVVSLTYTIAPVIVTPTASPVAGSYTGTQSVTLSSTTTGATFCYTTNGTTPAATTAGTCSTGTTYSTAISVVSTETLKVLGTKVGDTNSSVASFTFTITPTLSTITVLPNPGSLLTTGTLNMSTGIAGSSFCTFSDASTVLTGATGCVVTWTDAASHSSINSASGLVTGSSVGSDVVTATLGGITGTATVNISPPPVFTRFQNPQITGATPLIQ